VAQLRGEYPLGVICRVMQLPRSGVYARDRNDVVEQNASTTTGLRAHIEQIATTWPTDGYRRMTAQLRREAEPICGTNSKRVRRLMRELGVMGQAPKRRQCRTTNSEHPYPRDPNLVRDLRVDHPDHVWVGATSRTCACVWSSSIWRCSWTSAPERFGAGSSHARSTKP
jgi:putative transposase